jgi:hypothetical protein
MQLIDHNAASPEALQSRWGIVRTDCYEYITEENLTPVQLLAELQDLIAQWDDPGDECPGLLITRFDPVFHAESEAWIRQLREGRSDA